MAINYISKFDENGVYVSQIQIADEAKGLIKDGLRTPLTCYYIRGTKLIKMVDGNSELVYDITKNALSICLNRDGSKLYFLYLESDSIVNFNYIDTDLMSTIGFAKGNFSGINSNIGNIIIDKDNWLWCQFNTSTSVEIYCYNLIDDVQMSNIELSQNDLTMAINKNSKAILCSHNGSTIHSKIYERNVSDNNLIETNISLTQYTKDIKFNKLGQLVCLINDGTNSKIEIRSGNLFETINYSIIKNGELFYHLLLDASNRVYIDRFDTIKKRFRYNADLTNEVVISDRLANNHYNEDDIGFIHTEITGEAIMV